MKDLLLMIESIATMEALALTVKEDEAQTILDMESMFEAMPEDDILTYGIDNYYISIEDIDETEQKDR